METGIIQTGIVFDREQREGYNITVLAQDGGQPPLRLVKIDNCNAFSIGAFLICIHSGQTNLFISVLDVNDNTPSFTGEPYIATISEASHSHWTLCSANMRSLHIHEVTLLALQGLDGAVGQHVLTVQAVDADADANGNVTYILSGVGAELFSINATTGVVTVGNHGVDYESVLDIPYNLTVSAVDGGLDLHVIGPFFSTCCVGCIIYYDVCVQGHMHFTSPLTHTHVHCSSAPPSSHQSLSSHQRLQ